MRIERVCQRMRKIGYQVFTQLERKLKTPLDGEINFSSKPEHRYASVSNDPDYLFAFPGMGWRGEPPKFTIWVGDSESTAHDMKKSFYYVFLHEVMHTLEEAMLPMNSIFPLKMPEYTPINYFDSRCAHELSLDRGAVELGRLIRKETGVLAGMLIFSELVLKDSLAGNINLNIFSGVRELAKIKWIENNFYFCLPVFFRNKVNVLSGEFIKLIKEKSIIGENMNRILDVYVQILNLTQVDFGISR